MQQHATTCNNMQQHAPSWPSTVHRVILTNLWRRTNATKIWRERVSGCDQLATATRVSLVSHHFSHTPRNDVASYQKSTSQFSQGKTYQKLQYAQCRYPTNVLVIRFGYNHYMQPHSPCLSSLQLVQRLHVPFGLVNLCSQCLKQLCSVATWIKKLMLILKLFTFCIICFRFETCSNLCPYAKRKQFFRCKFLSFWRSPPLEADGALQSVQSVVPVGPSDPRPVPPLPDTKLKNWKTLFTSQIPGELPGVPAPSSSHRKSSNIMIKNHRCFTLFFKDLYRSSLHDLYHSSLDCWDCRNFYRFRSILHSFTSHSLILHFTGCHLTRCGCLTELLLDVLISPLHCSQRIFLLEFNESKFKKKMTYSKIQTCGNI